MRSIIRTCIHEPLRVHHYNPSITTEPLFPMCIVPCSMWALQMVAVVQVVAFESLHPQFASYPSGKLSQFNDIPQTTDALNGVDWHQDWFPGRL